MMGPDVAENDGTDFWEKMHQNLELRQIEHFFMLQVQSNAVLLQIPCATHSFLGSSRSNGLCLHEGQTNKQTGQYIVVALAAKINPPTQIVVTGG